MTKSVFRQKAPAIPAAIIYFGVRRGDNIEYVFLGVFFAFFSKIVCQYSSMTAL